MTTPQDDGGPAFPCQSRDGQGFPCGEMMAGMTLRDWFAGMALQGYLAGRNNTRGENPMNFEARRAAADCYKYADAMLAARKGDV